MGNHRVADAAAIAGLVAALAALLAIGSLFVVEPILLPSQGPDPCGYQLIGQNGGPDKQSFMSCVSAHADYYQYDPVTGSFSTPASRISQSLEPIGAAAPLLALGGVLISWLALAMRTGRRRIAFSALTISALLVAGMAVPLLVLVLGGAD